MRVIYLSCLLLVMLLHADITSDVINQHIKDEQQQKIFSEQKNDGNIKKNETYDTKLLEIKKDSIEENCVEIKKININNTTVFEEKDFEDLIEPYLNSCNGFKNLSNLRDKISNRYIDKGYVTSRAYFKAQDLSDGIVDIEILEGKIEKIEGENVNPSNLYITYENEVLNLRDVEVAVQQAQRLQSQKVNLQLIPGSKVGYTIVKIIGENNSPVYYGNIGMNNFGTKKTGKYLISSLLNYENLFDINDIVSLNINGTDNTNKDNNNKLGTDLSYSFPIGRALLNFDYSYSKYKQLNKDEFNQSFQSDGSTNSFSFGVDYKLYHSQRHTFDLISSVEKKSNKNFLNDVKLELQSYDLPILNLGVKHSYLGDGYDYYSKFIVSKGLAESQDNFAKQETDFTKYVLDLGYNKYFDTKNNLKFASTLRSQYSNNYLYGTEEISMGGIYSVRGFNNSGLSGNTGFYNRNELSLQYSVDTIKISPYIGLDFGYVKEDIHNIFGTINGDAIGTRFSWENTNLEIFFNAPLKDTSFTKEDSENFIGVSINYDF